MGTQVLSHAGSIFFFKLWQTLMSKIFYLTCLQGSKSSTVIVTYSQSQSFTGFPEEDFNREGWNAKATAKHNMGDDSTSIGSCQEADNDSQRAPADGDDGHIADGGAEHPEKVLPNVMGEEAVNVETESAADQQVQHLSHFFVYISHIFFSISVIFYISSPSGSWKHCW
jgi:hypothetical protein